MVGKTIRPNWKMVRFGDIVHQIKDRVTDIENCGLTEYTRGEHFTPGNLHLIGRSKIGDGQHGSAFHMRFKPGDVLYVSRNPQLRKVAIADYEGICANTTYVFRANQDILLQELLPFIMQTEDFVEYTIQHKRGSTNFYLNPSDIEPYEFPLPPLEEQRRIASLLQAVDEECESFRCLLEDFIKLESSVKSSYFTMNRNVVNLGKLIAEGVITFKTGPFGTVLKASSYVQNGIPVVNPVNMIRGKFFVDNGPFINEMEAIRLKDYGVLENDLIFGRKGDIGRGIFATRENEGYIIGSDCIRIRVLGNHIVPKYLFYFFTSPSFQRMLVAQAHGTTMLGINEKILARMEVNLPGYQEQLEIVRKIETLDKIKSIIFNKLTKGDDLRRAFIKHVLF